MTQSQQQRSLSLLRDVDGGRRAPEGHGATTCSPSFEAKRMDMRRLEANGAGYDLKFCSPHADNGGHTGGGDAVEGVLERATDMMHEIESDDKSDERNMTKTLGKQGDELMAAGKLLKDEARVAEIASQKRKRHAEVQISILGKCTTVITDMRIKNAALHKHCDILRQNLNEANTLIESLERQNTVLAQDLETKKSENANLYEDLTDLQFELHGLKGELPDVCSASPGTYSPSRWTPKTRMLFGLSPGAGYPLTNMPSASPVSSLGSFFNSPSPAVQPARPCDSLPATPLSNRKATEPLAIFPSAQRSLARTPETRRVREETTPVRAVSQYRSPLPSAPPSTLTTAGAVPPPSTRAASAVAMPHKKATSPAPTKANSPYTIITAGASAARRSVSKPTPLASPPTSSAVAATVTVVDTAASPVGPFTANPAGIATAVTTAIASAAPAAPGAPAIHTASPNAADLSLATRTAAPLTVVAVSAAAPRRVVASCAHGVGKGNAERAMARRRRSLGPLDVNAAHRRPISSAGGTGVSAAVSKGAGVLSGLSMRRNSDGLLGGRENVQEIAGGVVRGSCRKGATTGHADTTLSAKRVGLEDDIKKTRVPSAASGSVAVKNEIKGTRAATINGRTGADKVKRAGEVEEGIGHRVRNRRRATKEILTHKGGSTTNAAKRGSFMRY